MPKRTRRGATISADVYIPGYGWRPLASARSAVAIGGWVWKNRNTLQYAVGRGAELARSAYRAGAGGVSRMKDYFTSPTTPKKRRPTTSSGRARMSDVEEKYAHPQDYRLLYSVTHQAKHHRPIRTKKLSSYPVRKPLRLSLAMKKAISALSIPPYRKYYTETGVSNGAIGQSEWKLFECGGLDAISLAYQNHKGAIPVSGQYLINPNFTMAYSVRCTIDVINSTNVPQFYKCYKYVAKKDHRNEKDPTTGFANYWLDSSIDGGLQDADMVEGRDISNTLESTLSKPTKEDLNAEPYMNVAWSTVNKVMKPIQFSLGPGESRRLEVQCGERIFKPAEYNYLASIIADDANDHPNKLGRYTTGWAIRQQGTFVSDSADSSKVSTSATQTQFIVKYHERSAIIMNSQKAILNKDELLQAGGFTGGAVLMGGGQVAGKANFQNVT